MSWAGGESVEELGPSRSRICLNGIWRFQPAVGEAADRPVEAGQAWGAIRVPGSWSEWPGSWFGPSMPGLVSTGNGGGWAMAGNAVPGKGWYQKLDAAWYERPLEIPDAWKGREILLDIRRVSTDAVIAIDGRVCGRVEWPDGTVDVTSDVRPGTASTLRVLVKSSLGDGQRIRAMGVGQNTREKAQLDSRGLIGEVFLVTRPRGPRIDDVWVRTSVRRGRLEVDVDVAERQLAGPVDFVATIRDRNEKVVRVFTQRASVPGGASTVALAWDWADALLWDVGNPNLYTMDLSASGEGLSDGFRQTFGFRELWIDGREIIFNGTPFRLRPTSTLPSGPDAWHNGNGVALVMEKAMDDLLRAGFNCAEAWPADYTERGSFHFQEMMYEIADRKGLPMMGNATSSKSLFGWGRDRWNDANERAKWEAALRREWKRVRNSPSVVIWATSANIGGSGDDQDPRLIGHRLHDAVWLPEEANAKWWQHHLEIDEMSRSIKALDPTRPVLVHQGGPVGDIYAVNNYLNLLPLQEREEWLSDWSEHGTMPFAAIEFETPISVTFHRGRMGYVGSAQTEWLMTEHCAAYLGRTAYELESDAYRNNLASKLIGGFLFRDYNRDLIQESAAYQRLAELFITNTTRSWRTMGITGGMIAWNRAHGFIDSAERFHLPPPVNGQRGAWVESVPARAVSAFGGALLPAGMAFLSTNRPTMAWICGPSIAGDAAAFTAKDHAYRSGDMVVKRVALLNDSRQEQDWSLRVTLRHDGSEDNVIERHGRISVGMTDFVDLQAPTSGIAIDATDRKGSGQLHLSADIGNEHHEDTFEFRVFPVDETRAQGFGTGISLCDPDGGTSMLLSRLGIAAGTWDGSPGGVLIVGRRALSDGKIASADIEAFARSGGRALIMAQDPVWYEDKIGLRISHFMSRRVFPVNDRHPVFSGIDAFDLRDWRGSSTLLDPRPDYRDGRQSRQQAPTWGWRWGGRGAVASFAIEKPHRAGWRPLLECEFDLAYSPLLELDVGAGKVVVCTLDLEDHAAIDPGAWRLAHNLVDWLRAAPAGRESTVAAYVGDERGSRLLDLVGVSYRRVDHVDPSCRLLILGPDVNADVCQPVLQAGGRVLVLPRHESGAIGLGVRAESPTQPFVGAPPVPDWPEMRGISVGDLHWRADGPQFRLKGGEVAADGLFSRVVMGPGVAVFAQGDPLAIPADSRSYLRYTRWRLTHTLAVLVANLGGRLILDDRVFHPGAATDAVDLSGTWKVAWTNKLPESTTALADPGNSPMAASLESAETNEGPMLDAQVPGRWRPMDDADGEAVFRRHFTVPSGLRGKDLALHLGAIDDFDTVFVNGVQVGSTDAKVPDYWKKERVYRVPSGILRDGDNVIAVRVFDAFGGGGILGGPKGVVLVDAAPPLGLYHPDYREDFAMGDDPQRYYRW